jgi:hypothetical protein
LLAAHACKLKGVEAHVYSRKVKSNLQGSQYLHAPIPHIAHVDQGVHVHYQNRGTPEQYRRKVHGKWWDGIAAPEEFETEHMAWDIRRAYEVLWNRYSWGIRDFKFQSIGHLMHRDSGFEMQNYALVISTVPRTIWKQEGDEFIYSEGWAMGGHKVEERVGMMCMPDNTIVCDGTDAVAWTRLSKVFGHTTIEWPHHMDAKYIPGGAVRVIKPLRCTTDHQQGQPYLMRGGIGDPPWLFMGRYGEWKKGVVVTDVWDQTNKALEELCQE